MAGFVKKKEFFFGERNFLEKLLKKINERNEMRNEHGWFAKKKKFLVLLPKIPFRAKGIFWLFSPNVFFSKGMKKKVKLFFE